jgi:hypothetical protein
MTTVVQGGVKTFLMHHGQVKHLTSIFTPSTKKRDVTQCTIALFLRANKILLIIIQKQLQTYIGYETAIEQAGLRKGRGGREQIVSVMETWTAQWSTTKMSNCFINYTKDFGSVQHLKMWKSIRSVGITKHLTVLI